MFRKNKLVKTSLNVNQSYQGETIEHKMQRIMNNNEAITDGAPAIYTERKDGVNPLMDIRTDRFDLAVEEKSKEVASHIAQREQSIGERSYDTMNDDQKKAFHEKYPTNKFNTKPETGQTS